MAVKREEVFALVREKYGTVPDYPWDGTPDAAVLRKQSKKWYGLVMTVKGHHVGMNGRENTDILNIKCSTLVREILIGEGKAVPAYHMNKRLWVSLLLDSDISLTEVEGALAESYDMVK